MKNWEKAAEDAQKLIPHMPEPDREHWKDVAVNYRRNAADYKSIIEQYLKDNANLKSLHFRTEGFLNKLAHGRPTSPGAAKAGRLGSEVAYFAGERYDRIYWDDSMA